MNRWMTVAMLVALVAAISGLVLSAVASGAPELIVGGACGGFTLGLIFAMRALVRDRAVRTLVSGAYRAGSDRVGAEELVQVLRTPDVIAARTAAARAQEGVWRDRYNRRDASDY